MIDRLRQLLSAARARGADADAIVATSIVSMGLRVAGILLSLLSQLILARLLGAAEYGRYVIALGWAMVLVIVARRGLDNMTLRVATHYWEEGRSAELHGLVHYAARVVGQSTLLIVLAMAGIRLLWPGIAADLSWIMLVAIGLAVLTLALLGFFSSLLRSIGWVVASQSFEQILRPSFLIALLAVTYWAGIGSASAVQAMILTSASILGALALAFLAWRRAVPAPTAGGASQQDRREWHSIGTAFLVIAIAQEALNQSGILLLGIIGTNVEAAHFSAASRYNSLLAFGLMAVGLVSGPMIASAHRRADQPELASIVRTSARFSLVFAVLAALPLVLFGPWLLNLFGSGFDAAYPALLVLVAGSLANASTGVVGYLLALTGNHALTAKVMVGALAINLLASVVLIPLYGVLGAALASSLALVAWNLALLVQARKLTGVTSWAFGRNG